MSMLKILSKLSRKKDAIQFQQLTGFCTGFKAIPANGKRWKPGEHPEKTEIRYIGTYEDAMELMKQDESEKIAFILWVPRKEYLAEMEAKRGAKQ